MRPLNAPAVYVHERVVLDTHALTRVERMMAQIDTASIKLGLDDDELEDMIETSGWRESRRLSGDRKVEDPVIIFNAFDFDQPNRGQSQGSKDIFGGGGAWTLRGREARMQQGVVCQTAWELHTVRGCLHKCDYCYLQNVLNIAVNIEALVDRLETHLPGMSQTLYKWDSHSDILALEPQYDATRPMVESFGRQDRAYLMLYTKSDNIDFLEHLPHNGRTIVCWSLSGHTQSRTMETDTASAEDRIAAMRKCQGWGYPVRCRLAPIIPIKGWQDEYRDLIDRLFAEAQPDVVSLQTLSRFPDYEMLPRMIDMDGLDPSFVDAARASKAEMAGQITGPFPEEKRLELYSFVEREIQQASPRTPVTVCLETPGVWDEMTERTGLTPDAFPCCCGGNCTPGSEIMTGDLPLTNVL